MIVLSREINVKMKGMANARNNIGCSLHSLRESFNGLLFSSAQYLPTSRFTVTVKWNGIEQSYGKEKEL